MKKTPSWTAVLALSAVLLGSLSAHADSPQEERRNRAADRIEQSFERDRVLGNYDLDAEAEGERTGYIELEGRVKTKAQRDRALSIARRIAPNFRIVNRIKIDHAGFMGRNHR